MKPPLRGRPTAGWPILLAFALAGCEEKQAWPGLQARVEDAALTVRQAGGQTFLSTDRGNLARAAAFAPEEREARFAEFLNDFRRELGLSGAAGSIAFRRAASEVSLEWGEGSRWTTHLEPIHRGASIVDRPQSAAYDVESGELRAALVRSVDFTTLPGAPAVDSVARERARAAVLARLQADDLPEGRLVVRADPVVSAELRRAGYLVEYRGRDEAGAGRWIRALYDPAADEVLILRREERDDAPEREEPEPEARGRT